MISYCLDMALTLIKWLRLLGLELRLPSRSCWVEGDLGVVQHAAGWPWICEGALNLLSMVTHAIASWYIPVSCLSIARRLLSIGHRLPSHNTAHDSPLAVLTRSISSHLLLHLVGHAGSGACLLWRGHVWPVLPLSWDSLEIGADTLR